MFHMYRYAISSMRRLVLRAVRLLLIPCLVTDPLVASAGPQSFFSHSTSTVPFTRQALSEAEVMFRPILDAGPRVTVFREAERLIQPSPAPRKTDKFPRSFFLKGAAASLMMPLLFLFGCGNRVSPPSMGTPPTALAVVSAVDFGNIAVGTSNKQPVALTNKGSTDVTVSQISVDGGPDFSIANVTLPLKTPLIIHAGAAYNLSVAFSPQTVKTLRGTISIVSDATDNPLTVSLSGDGTPTVIGTPGIPLAVSPLGFAFAPAPVGINPPPSQTFLITNTGNTGDPDLTISKVAVTGSNFSVSGFSPDTIIGPGESISVTVTYTPTPGASIGSLSIVGEAAGTPLDALLPLAGTGAHSVFLSWNDSEVVAGYNVYRSVFTGGPYTRINTSLVANTTYVDITVQPLDTYYYVVTAVDGSGNESAFSNQTAAVIPVKYNPKNGPFYKPNRVNLLLAGISYSPLVFFVLGVLERLKIDSASKPLMRRSA